MSAYPPYSFQLQQMNNPYQGNYQPMQNPYMAQMGQYQQNLQPAQIQQVQQQGIVGKIVNDFSELTANDVPMNGSAAFFPKADGSELQVRSWTPNGTIQTIVYKPIQPENHSNDTNIPQMDFNALNEDVRALREDILARLDSIEKSVAIPATKATTRAKKGADEE